MSCFFIFLKQGILLFLFLREKINSVPFVFKFFLAKFNKEIIFVFEKKWIVCLTIIISNFSPFLRYFKASDFLNDIFFLVFLFFKISIPIAFVLNLYFFWRKLIILALPQPISKTLVFFFNITFFFKKYGLYSYCLYSYGLYSYDIHSYGLYSYGLYSYGLYGNGLYGAFVVMVYIVMAHMVMVYTAMAYIAMASAAMACIVMALYSYGQYSYGPM